MTRGRDKTGSYARNVVHSILRVVIFHFVCWTPFWFFVLIPMLSFFNISISSLLSSRWVATLRLLSSFLPYINSAGNWIFYAALNRELIRNLNESRRRTIHKELSKFFRTFVHLTEESSSLRSETPKSCRRFVNRLLMLNGGEIKNVAPNQTQFEETRGMKDVGSEQVEDGDCML
ncbi:unnamed protein product [Anisakis simplex]|uniref:G_PROTEIN_RECEP_F1_2 domain-containing protein n=1 Tax=Anisakis simplex TaxID=6269 RepID=A0A0M3JZW0_ANISI|nr:unnamed protein product [Anisakis simplex]